ncbi:MAG: hypothetical protein JWP81_3851 [Ferruginibacter sp.]|nr:hypothetical protein [Ferruginibacter sp.]
MQHFIKCPDWVFRMFADLCFSQIKEQLQENVIYQHSNPESFAFENQLFVFIHNRSVILERAIAENDMGLNPANN